MMAPSPLETVAGTSLRELAAKLPGARVAGDASVAVRGVRQDSRRVEPGELFAVRSGAKTSGWDHVSEAIRRGAVAVMAESEPVSDSLGVPLVIAKDVRTAIGRAAAIVYGDPTRKLGTVGITGTNGKTTTSYLTRRALVAAGARPGLIGTIAYEFEGFSTGAPNTTPEADDIARMARMMLDRGASHLVMEVSSHALAQARVDAVHFRVAAFTNLTQDHLEFHKTMAAYGEAKARLFVELAPEHSVINVDDPFGRDLARRGQGPLVTVSSVPGADADIVPERALYDARGTAATVKTPRGNVEIESKLIGAHNLSNMLMALGIASALGVDVAAAAASFADVAVPGRLERCDAPGDDLVVLVDYAHTPDALDRALGTLASLRDKGGKGRLICVFGCGGDRDPTKRAPMGRVASKWADIVVVTSDNPRSEDPAAIVEAIQPGLEAARAVVVELDRGRAIGGAIAGARAGDVVLVAGKGHETYQIVGAVTRHFDDREEARAALARRRASRGAQG